MSKIKKVTLEFEDKIFTLEGDDANRWIIDVNASVTIGKVAGTNLPRFNWNIIEKTGGNNEKTK